jgi:hypothetical protein
MITPAKAIAFFQLVLDVVLATSFLFPDYFP